MVKYPLYPSVDSCRMFLPTKCFCLAMCYTTRHAGGAANPYVSVEVGDEKQRTSVETNTVDPVWDEEIMVFSETTSRKVLA